MMLCQAAHLQPLYQHCVFPVVELVRMHFRDGYLHGFRCVILAGTKDCAQLYCSRVNPWKTAQTVKEEALWRPANMQGNILALYPRGQTGKVSDFMGPDFMGPADCPVPLTVPLGTTWFSWTVKDQLFFMSAVGGEFPAPLSHLIYPQNIQDNNLCSHWPFLILWLPGLALRHRA